MNLFIDIETIPAQLEWVKNEIQSKISAPGNYKKPEAIQGWMEKYGAAETETQWLKTSFNGSVGEIISICFAVEDGEVIQCGRKLGESEGDMLNLFFEKLTDELKQKSGTSTPCTWIGHYICEFDLKFIYQRAKINKCDTKGIYIPNNEKPWNQHVFDTCYEWSGAKSKGFGSLDALCKIFGIDGKGDLDGSKVWEYVKSGHEDEVHNYCADDVKKVRKIYNLIK